MGNQNVQAEKVYCRKGCSWLKKLIIDLKNSIVYVLGRASVNAVIISDASLCSAKHDTKEKKHATLAKSIQLLQ